MPKELSCLFVKKANENSRPSIHPHYLSGSTVETHAMLKDVDRQFPGTLGSDEEGALLSPSQASELLKDWKMQQTKGGNIRMHSAAFASIDQMISLAENGHSLTLYTE